MGISNSRIDNSIKIIKFAIENNISIKKACRLNNYGDTYVKNTKSKIYSSNMEGVSEEKFNSFDEAYQEYENMKNNISVKKSTNNDLPKNTEVMGESLSYSEKDNGTASVEWKANSNYREGHIKTLDQLLKVSNVDTEIWKVSDYIVNKWDVTIGQGANGLPETIENFQVKAKLERDGAAVKEKIAGEIFKELVKEYKAPVLDVDKLEYNTNENNLFEIALFDLHLGKLAWKGETGENYDTKIARKRYLEAILRLLKYAKGFPYNKILFPIGSDFFNSDTIFNTTTKGTYQDEDLRWQKTFKVGNILLIDAINLLKQTGVPIDVIVIPGNHDFERSYYMGEFLSAWFRNDDSVNIDNHASPRKYYRFGKVLLGFTHGSEEKEDSLPMLMSSEKEAKRHWSDTIFHEWHLGHIHRKRKNQYVIRDKFAIEKEESTVTIRYLSSLTGTEEWHHKKGFIGSTKAGEAFIWNDKDGLRAHLNANIII